MADKGNRVREGRLSVVIPSCRAKRKGLVGGQRVRQERDERKQTQQGWTGAQNSVGRPLALAFKAHMNANFCKGDYNSPTLHSPGQEVQGAGRLVSGEEGSRGQSAQRVAHQHPPARPWVKARGVRPVAISSLRFCPPYQANSTVCQAVRISVSRALRDG